MRIRRSGSLLSVDGEPPFEVALPHAEGGELARGPRRPRRPVWRLALVERGDASLALLGRLLLLAQGLIDDLQRGEELDLRWQLVLLLVVTPASWGPPASGPSVTRTHDRPVMSRQL